MTKGVMQWLSCHGEEVSCHSGKWVAVRPPEGIVASGCTMEEVMSEWKKQFPGERPVVFLVPKKGENFP